MANNYLITGYWGEPHVTAENDRGLNVAISGPGRFVLPVGEQFKAEYIGNNTIRMYDGKLMNNGAAAGIPAGEFVDLLVAETGQGMNRNDLIVFQYSQDASTLIESGTFVVVQGEETSGTAVDPELTNEDLMTNKATFDQMALWRVSVEGTIISDPVQLFTVAKSLPEYAALITNAQTSADNAQASANKAQTTADNAATAATNAQTTANGKAPTSHASSETTYGKGTSSNYGHVKLSDSTSTTSGASAGIAATPTAVKAAYDLANTAKSNAATAQTTADNAASAAATAQSTANTKLDKSGGTMTGALIAAADSAVTTAKVRNSSLNSAETTPTKNGEIAWTYE